MIYIIVVEYSINFLGEYLNNISKYLTKQNINNEIIIFCENLKEKYKNLQSTILIYVSIIPLKISTKEYYLNVGQLIYTKNLIWCKQMDLILNGKFSILDFSPENINLIKERNINRKILYIPYLYNQTDPIFTFNSDIKIYDVCIVGSMTERRNNVYNILKSAKIKVKYIHNSFGIKRDMEIAKSKILLNIHSYDNSNIIESIRCYPAIFKKIIVLSETSQYDKKIKINNFIIYTEYNNILTMVENILNSYDKIYKNIYDDNLLNDATVQLNTLMDESIIDLMN